MRLENCVDSASGLSLDYRRDVRIDVHGHPRRRVTEPISDGRTMLINGAAVRHNPLTQTFIELKLPQRRARQGNQGAS